MNNMLVKLATCALMSIFTCAKADAVTEAIFIAASDYGDGKIIYTVVKETDTGSLA